MDDRRPIGHRGKCSSRTRCTFRGEGSGGPLEPLLVARALDDGVTLAEADAGAGDAVLFPELRDLLLDLLVLRDESGIVLLRERVHHLRAPEGEAVDVVSDVG